ncbi:thiazole synthase [bacterium]|jgi:thiazole synthase|nr:thiazole synthase [bacterium]
MKQDLLKISDKTFNSRLILGTGKFSSAQVMKNAIESSGTEMVTVAMRRVDVTDSQDDFIESIDRSKISFLPNTSGARTAEEAIKLAKIAKISGLSSWIKLEITPEPNYLLPDPIETLKAAQQLVKDGFTVLPYINADPILAKHLEEVGCAAVMPLASPIGSNQGIRVKELIQIIIEQSSVPVIVDAGLGRPSHAAEALELGADAVIVNTAIATANDPILNASAFNMAVKAGRDAYLSGLPSEIKQASASSPFTSFLN